MAASTASAVPDSSRQFESHRKQGPPTHTRNSKIQILSTEEVQAYNAAPSSGQVKHGGHF